MDDIVYPPALLNLVKMTDQLFVEKIPFNQYLGMKVDEYAQQPLQLRIDFKPQLVGNYTRNMLHGGVTMSVLDAVGGMQVYRECVARMQDQPTEQIKAALALISTVNLNVQFLRPGIGESFHASATVRRYGKKLAFVDMQMLNHSDAIIATAHGVYNVS